MNAELGWNAGSQNAAERRRTERSRTQVGFWLNADERRTQQNAVCSVVFWVWEFCGFCVLLCSGFWWVLGLVGSHNIGSDASRAGKSKSVKE